MNIKNKNHNIVHTEKNSDLQATVNREKEFYLLGILSSICPRTFKWKFPILMLVFTF